MIRNFEFDYDTENDSLFMFDSKLKSKASVELNDLIIDYSSKGEISSLEVLNAKRFFSDIAGKYVDSLASIKECKLEIIPKNNILLIKFFFKFNSDEKLSLPLLIPTINEPSKALV